MQSLVVQVGAERVDETKVFELTGLAEVLLLVQDVVLGASNDTSILNTAYGLGNGMTGEVWVRRKALPVTLPLISMFLGAWIL